MSVRMIDVTGMTEHYTPVLNENGGQIMNGHLSDGMRVILPDPFFGGTFIGIVESIELRTAAAAGGNWVLAIELDPVRGIWVVSGRAYPRVIPQGVEF